jgi:hypothetical protein
MIGLKNPAHGNGQSPEFFPSGRFASRPGQECRRGRIKLVPVECKRKLSVENLIDEGLHPFEVRDGLRTDCTGQGQLCSDSLDGVPVESVVNGLPERPLPVTFHFFADGLRKGSEFIDGIFADQWQLGKDLDAAA